MGKLGLFALLGMTVWSVTNHPILIALYKVLIGEVQL